jgi:3-oxoacyl-(acyl-carrier-protein) synthase
LRIIHAEIKSLLEKLDSIQKEPPSPDSDSREAIVQAALQEQFIREEQLWK